MNTLEAYDFAVLELDPEIDNRERKAFTSFFLRLFKKRNREKKETYRMYIFKRKMRKYRSGKPLKILDKTGKRIILPYTLEELDAMDKAKLKSYMDSIMEEEQVETLVAEEKLKKYISEKNLVDGKFLKFLYLKEILENVIRRHSISKKRMKVIVIDSKEIQTEYLLDQIKEDLNYLTLVTHRPEYFKTYIENVYEESGLLISLINKPLASAIEGNIIINLDKEEDKNYRYFEEKGIYIDLSEISPKKSYIIAKRIDITYYNHIIIWIKGEVVDNFLAQAGICGKPMDTCLENIGNFNKHEDLKIANVVCKY